MGPYYDAVSLMIWRLPEPRQTPWAGFQGNRVRPAPTHRRMGFSQRLLRRIRLGPLRPADQLS